MVLWTDGTWLCPECYGRSIFDSYTTLDIAEKFGDTVQTAAYVDQENDKANMRRAGIIDGFI